MELVLLYRLLGEGRNLFFGLSLVLRKSPPFAMIFRRVSWSASMFTASWLILSGDSRAHPTSTWADQAQPARNGNDSTVLSISFLTIIINHGRHFRRPV